MPFPGLLKIDKAFFEGRPEELINHKEYKMTYVNIAVKKVELIEWLVRLEDKSLIEQVESLKNKAVTQAYEAKMKPMSSTEYKSMLVQAEDDLKNGRITLQEDMERESSNW